MSATIPTMASPEAIPDHAALVEILSAPDGPPRLTLDIGGSADLDGDGLVTVHLDDDGELIFEDA